MDMRDKIAACIPDYGQSTDEDFAVKAADAILAALPDMIPDLVWGSSGFIPSESEWFTSAKSIIGTYHVVHEHSGCYVSLNLKKIAGWNELWERDEAKAAANAHYKAQLAKAMGWTV